MIVLSKENSTSKSECFACKILDALLNGIFIYDVRFHEHVYINEQFTNITGYTIDDLEDMGFSIFEKLVHPDDLGRFLKIWDRIIGGDEEMAEIECRLKTKDGRWIWGLSRKTVLSFSPDGSVSQIIGSFLDITNRKQAEERLRQQEAGFHQLADAMPQLVWTAGPDGKVKYYNVRYKEYSGISQNSDGTYDTSPVLHEDDMDSTHEAWRRAVRTGENYQMEHRIRRVDGKYYWHLSRATPIRDRQGDIVKWLGTATDIEHFKRTEAELMELSESLEQKVDERTKLAEQRSRRLQALAVDLIEAEERERRRVSELLHEDLQQMLASALMQLQSFQGRDLRPVKANVERLIEESIGKSRRLSHELSPPMLRYLGLTAALESLASQMGEQFGLKVELHASAERQFEFEPLKVFLYRTARELLFNVVRHSGAKTARVELSSGKDHVRLVVGDEGRGFDPAILKSNAFKAGLGLVSIRERANYLGGDLKVESTPGQGGRVILTIPMGVGNNAEARLLDPATDRAPVATVLESGGAKNIRVLFVDDHKVMRQGLVKLISAQPDIEAVGEAANGREAVEQALLLKPDVILMDVSMPEMDGIEATKRIKEKMPEVRVIGLSMYEDDPIADSMTKAGAESFLSKTASPARLLEAIYGLEREGQGQEKDAE